MKRGPGKKTECWDEPSAKFALAVPEYSKYSTLQKGKIAEVAVLFRLVLHGLTVYGSIFDGDKADWVVKAPSGRLITVQVKTARATKTQAPSVKTCCSGPLWGTRQSYKEGDLDVLVGYVFRTDTCYVWTWDEIKEHKTSISVTPKAAEAWHKVMGL